MNDTFNLKNIDGESMQVVLKRRKWIVVVIEEYFNEIMQNTCECGRSHKIALPKVIVEKGAILELPKIVEEYNGKKVFVLADVNTYKCAGQKVCETLSKANIPHKIYVNPDNLLEPDEKAVGSTFMHYDNECDLIISVGSGVINDIGKILAATTRNPYFIVATAPSMDGYASTTSSMSMDGVKVSLPSKCADVIMGDIDVLKNAPMRMLLSGLGDMIAKYVSIAEWRIAHEITGEYYCEKIANLVRIALKRCVDNAEGVLKRDENAIKVEFEGLILSGFAMAFAGVSRPASGVEHYFSHVWDMRGLEFGAKVDLHGIQCAVATLIVAGIYEKLLILKPDKERALNYVKNFSYEQWSKALREFLGKGAETMILLEKKEEKYSVEKHAKRLNVILEKWDIICKIIKDEIPSAQTIEIFLDRIGAPKTMEELSIDCDLSTVLQATKDIRDKYVLSRLLWDLGIEEKLC